MADIVLVGALGCDLFGPSRLEKALVDLNPNVVAVQGSEEDVRLAIEHAVSDKKIFIEAIEKSGVVIDPNSLLSAMVDNSIMYGAYWSTTSKAYTQMRAIPFHYLEDPGNAQMRRDRLMELLLEATKGEPQGTLGNHCSDEWVLKSIHSGYEEALAFMDTNCQVISGEDLMEIYVNKSRTRVVDDFMESRVRFLVDEYPGKKVACVVDVERLIDHPFRQTLYSRIKDLNPARRLIYDPRNISVITSDTSVIEN